MTEGSSGRRGSGLEPGCRVLASPTTPGGDRCVDLFVRPEGTFGYEEFRRDPEDGGRWTVTGFHASRRFDTLAETLHEARRRVGWLEEVLATWPVEGVDPVEED